MMTLEGMFCTPPAFQARILAHFALHFTQVVVLVDTDIFVITGVCTYPEYRVQEKQQLYTRL